jgi:hypothetical protein
LRDGNDYYNTNERRVVVTGEICYCGEVFDYDEITQQYFSCYQLPVMHTETNYAQGASGADAVDMFIRKLRKIHSGAEEQMQRYYLEHQKRAEKLVSQLRDVLEAFQDGETDQERGTKIASAMHDESELLLAECEELYGLCRQ